MINNIQTGGVEQPSKSLVILVMFHRFFSHFFPSLLRSFLIFANGPGRPGKFFPNFFPSFHVTQLNLFSKMSRSLLAKQLIKVWHFINLL